MPWIYAIIGLLVGCVVGVVVSRITTPQNKNQKTLQKELDSTKFALEQQRQELADHFAQTAEMLDTIGKDYTKLYQHLAKTSQELIPNLPEQDNPFVKTAAKHNKSSVTPIAHNHDISEPDSEDEHQPKDYANGATGLLKNEEIQIINSKEMVNVQAN